MDKNLSKKRMRNKLDLCGKKFTTSDLQDLLIGNVTNEEFSNICSIILSHNQLTSLPEEIGNFSNLTELDISYNQLTGLPKQFGNLSNLTNTHPLQEPVG